MMNIMKCTVVKLWVFTYITTHLEGNVFVQCDDNDFDDAIYFSDDNEIRVNLLAYNVETGNSTLIANFI
jgi:hypothetical protein